jgi:heptosyltransferase I
MTVSLVPLRILIVRLSAHGDILQTLPLLNTLRVCHPTAHIGWLVDARGAALLEGHPQLNTLHVVALKALPPLANPLNWPQWFTAFKAMRNALQAEHYTMAIDAQGLLKSALWPWLANIPKRVGFKRSREFASLFYTHPQAHHHMGNPNKPAAQWFNDLALATGIKHLPPMHRLLAPTNPAITEQFRVQLHPLKNKPLIALAPGTLWPSKQWPHWPALFKALGNHNVILIGSKTESTLITPWLADVFGQNDLGQNDHSVIALPYHWLDLTGQTDWPGLQALMPFIDVLIGPDSAPLHLADAVAGDAPTPNKSPHIIGLFGPTAPGRTGPLGKGHTTLTTTTVLPCQPCFKKTCPLPRNEKPGNANPNACLTTLTVDQVMQAVQQVISQLPPANQHAFTHD